MQNSIVYRKKAICVPVSTGFRKIRKNSGSTGLPVTGNCSSRDSRIEILNQIGDNPIYWGSLLLPLSRKTKSEVTHLVTYTIKPGDTLYKISDQFKIPMAAIQAANPALNPYNLLPGQTVRIPTEYREAGQSLQFADPSGISKKELDLRNTLRKLWEQHVAWARMAIVSAAAGSPDLNFVVSRLLQNALDMAAALKPIYGENAATKFGNLISEHLKIALQLVNAVKSNDTQAAQNAEKLWYANADQIAGFLSGINPYISYNDFKKMLYTHLDLTKAEAAAQISQKYAESISLYDRIETQALSMADAMAEGIVRQFPDLFR